MSVVRTAFIAALFCIPAIVTAAVDINTAGVAALSGLTGIGEVKANAIIDYRDTNGSFDSPAEIQLVSGIGPATFASIEDDITVSASNDETDESDDENTHTGATPTEEETGSETESSTGSGTDRVRVPVESVSMDVPETAFAKRTVTMHAAPENGTNGRLIRYRWSFGDGATGTSRSETHTYLNPGTYIVSVTARYAGETRSARSQITIEPIRLSLNRTVEGIAVTNHASHEIDLAHMRLVGGSTFTFPAHTIVLSGETIVFPARYANASADSPVKLFTRFGRLVAIDRVAASPPPRKAPVGKHSHVSEVSATTGSATTTANVSDIQQHTAAAKTSTRIPDGTLPYLGLAGLLVLATVSVYVSRASSVTSTSDPTFT